MGGGERRQEMREKMFSKTFLHTIVATQNIVRPDYNILLSQCLTCLNFDRFIVLTSVRFGSLVQWYSISISIYCWNGQYYARLFDMLSQCHITQ